jgi:hypothetical protein
VSTTPSGYVTAFGEAGVPTLGLEGGVGCNPRVTFDGKVRKLGLKTICLCPLIRANILSTADSLRHHCKLGGDSASISDTSVSASISGTRHWSRFDLMLSRSSILGSGVGGSSDGQDEQSRIILVILPPETGEQPSLSPGWREEEEEEEEGFICIQ